jgi:hypothetical protein
MSWYFVLLLVQRVQQVAYRGIALCRRYSKVRKSRNCRRLLTFLCETTLQSVAQRKSLAAQRIGDIIELCVHERELPLYGLSITL